MVPCTADASALGACHNACRKHAYRHQLPARFLAPFDAEVGGRWCSLWVAEGDDRAQGFSRRQGVRPDGARKRIEEWEGLATIRLLP